MMSEAQIQSLITSGWPFFTVTEQGDILARYVPFGPVFRWKRNQMIPTAVQGSDLCWWLHTANEEGHSLGDAEAGKAADHG